MLPDAFRRGSQWKASRSLLINWQASGSGESGHRRSALGQQATSSAAVSESPLANRVIWWPCAISSSVRYETTRSVPPYCAGGTLSISGAT